MDAEALPKSARTESEPSTSSNLRGPLSRRQFGCQMAAGLSAATAAGITVAQTSVPPPAATPVAEPAKSALAVDNALAPSPTVPPNGVARRPPSTATLILAQLVQTYPSDHYTDEVLDGIMGDIQLDLSRGRELSRFGLKNSDEPATVLHPFRSDQPRPTSRRDHPQPPTPGAR